MKPTTNAQLSFTMLNTTCSITQPELLKLDKQMSEHVELFMIVNHNCCIKLVPLVMSIYDARSHIHQTCTFCSTAPSTHVTVVVTTCHYVTVSLCHCHYVTMSLSHYVTKSLCHYVTHNATINCVAVLTAIWIRLNIEWCRDGSVGIVTTVRPGRSR